MPGKMKEIGKNPDKGQHFLVDKDVLRREVEISELSNKDRVIEIGAGKGTLTRELVKKSKKVLGFEIDKRYGKELESLEKEYDNLKMIYSDATGYSWEGFDKIVSNIPYYLGEKVIAKAVTDNIPFIVLIVGENFKDILINKSSKSGILANIFYKIEPIEKIDKNSFSPPPRVNSWMIKLTAKDEGKHADFIRNILKRKGKLKNAIISSFIREGNTKRKSKELLKKLDLLNSALESPSSRISGKMLAKLEEELKKEEQSSNA